MPKKSRDALKAKGKLDVYTFDPNEVVLVDDKTSAIYDDRINLDYDEALVLNMMYAPDPEGPPQGVLKHLIGRRNNESGKVEIVDGRRRTKAAREANRRLKKQGREPIRLPVHVRRANDALSMSMMISSNGFALEDSPMNRAKKAQRFIDLGRDESEVATLMGVSKATVGNLLSLLDAPAVVRNAVDAGKISASDGYKLSREEPQEAKKKLSELIEKAPRTPGKKRSKNAKKAREILGQPEAKSDVSSRTLRSDDDVAEAIASWIEATWGGGNWDGAPALIPERIRKGEWRQAKTSAA